MIRAWLSITPFALIAACASAPPAGTSVHYGRVAHVDAVTVEGEHHLGIGAIVGAVAGGVDNGVSVTQATDPVFRVGDRVRVDGSGNEARVVRV